VTPLPGLQRRVMTIWRSAWPSCALLLFVGLAIVRLIPPGYIRAAVAAPVVLLVPGSLTLGAICGAYRRPRGTVFICLSALLGLAWAAFAPLILYVLGVRIAASSTYLCLLVVCAVLVNPAQARILIDRRGGTDPAIRPAGAEDAGQPDAQADTAQTPTTGSRYRAIAAIIGGLGLLVGGAYAIDHLPHPAPVGYTWIAWTGPKVSGVMNISRTGTTLPFQIIHQQPDTTAFRLEAEWLGTHRRPMAGPLALTIGPDRTFHGDLYIPPLRDGCIYRLVLTLTATQPAASPAQDPQTWSINADVRDPAKSAKTCPAS
jgi:hypothetical protein